MAVLAIAGAVPPKAPGQLLPPVEPEQIGGLPQVRPVVPLTVPRPAEGPQPQERWDIRRRGPEAAPTATFLESLKGLDAAFEIVLGQARIFTTREPIETGDYGIVAVGDPSVVEIEILNPRMIRLTGLRPGVTDLTFVTEDGQTFVFEVHVVYDLVLLRAQLQRIYPDALIRLSQFREHIILEGQARSPVQVVQIEETVEAFLASVSVPPFIGESGGIERRDTPAEAEARRADADARRAEAEARRAEAEAQQVEAFAQQPGAVARPDTAVRSTAPVRAPAAQVINLLRVPGLQQRQVLLQVRVAELNRTAFRAIGADIFTEFGAGNVLGTRIGGAAVSTGGLDIGDTTTAFGIFPSGRLEIMLRALRENSVLSILAEPNLIALDGHPASFLAGGQFPIPIQQAGAVAGGVTIEWKDFGVQLDFVPTILDDRAIRLYVAPEYSSIDPTVGTTLVPGGVPTPGVTTRRVETTVELQEGQTLVLAGLLEVVITGNTQRIPLLGDLPYLGPLFSNTTHERTEKELLVMVTPYMVSPMEAHQVPCPPGAEILDPNDLEFYLLNRIEGRRGREFRSTTAWDDPQRLAPLMHLERDHLYGPAAGFSP